MKQVKKIASVAAVISFLLLLALPTFVASTDASSVLESSDSKASVGDDLVIRARGRTNSSSDDSTDYSTTRMRLDLTIARIGQRGVQFSVSRGFLLLGNTRFTITDGAGVASRPEKGRFNGTVIFGFAVNLTGQDGELAELRLFGTVLRNKNDGRVLVMRGSVSLDTSVLGITQRGLIHKSNT